MTRRIQTPRKEKPPMRDTHIYLTLDEYAELERRAELECRSVTAQVLSYVRQGLAKKPKEVRE